MHLPTVQRGLLNLACAAAVAAVLAGCAQQPGRAGPAPRLYPFDSAVYFTPEQTSALSAQEERATQQCMARLGFTYTPAPAGREREPANPYGLVDAYTARTDGYGITSAVVRPPGTGARTAADDTAADGNEQRSAAWQRALNGTDRQRRTLVLPTRDEVVVPTDGCATRARTAVYGDGWDDAFYLGQALSNEVIVRVGKDPSVTAAWRDWSACMRGHGFARATPDSVRTAVENRVRRATSRREPVQAAARAELRTAAEDSACQSKAGLRARIEASQKRAERTTGRPHRRELARLHSLHTRAAARAAHATAAPATSPATAR